MKTDEQKANDEARKRWSDVIEALDALYHKYQESYDRYDCKEELDALMTAWDAWLD